MPSIRDAVRVTLSALICSAALMAGLWHLCRPREPEAFYTRPAETGDAKPGSLLRTEPFERALPAGSKGWRIVYTTTHADGAPAISSAIVVTADRPGPALRPVIAWAHGTTGMAKFYKRELQELLERAPRRGS